MTAVLAPRRPGLLRERQPHAHARVTSVELFFDLVFVFAVTQLSHGLLAELTPLGAARTALLFLAVWWVWIFTSWAMNWLDPERAPVRLALFALMLAGLVMSISIPEAFGARGLSFALAYAAMQVGRTAFVVWAVGPERLGLYRNFQRILAWMALSALFWTAGGLVEGGPRLALWAVALGIEYVSPWAGFWTPGLGCSTTADWTVEGGHIAERAGLFIIIALGESILVTGATFGTLAWTAPTAAAFAVAFIGSVAMWWVYFHIGAERATQHITHSADPGRLARFGYTYLHIPIVAGIVVGAVADELVLAHPGGEAGAAAVATILGGTALYLLGNAFFKRITLGHLPLSHLAGLGLLALLAAAAVAAAPSPLTLAAAATAILILVAAWEHVSLAGRRTAA